MEIREMTREDLPQVAQLYYGFWGKTSDLAKMEGSFARIKEQDSHILLVAQEGEYLIGTVMGVVCQEIYGDCRPFLVLENMIVSSHARQKGVGKKLVEELEHRAQERGCTQILVQTEKKRLDAVAFYNSLGYDPEPMQGYKKKLQ